MNYIPAASSGQNLSALAQRIRMAVDVSEGVIRLQDCLQVASELEGLASASVTVPDHLVERKITRARFGIATNGAAALLNELMARPGTVIEYAELASTIGCSLRALRTYASRLRTEMAMRGLGNVLQSVRNNGYLICLTDFQQIDDLHYTTATKNKFKDRFWMREALQARLRIKAKGVAELLALLLESPGTTFSPVTIRERTGFSWDTAKVYMSKLRKSLEPFGLKDEIKTTSGLGYKISERAAAMIRSIVSP